MDWRFSWRSNNGCDMGIGCQLSAVSNQLKSYLSLIFQSWSNPAF